MAVEDSIPHSRCLYQRLGLSRSASNDEIKRHYRKLAMKWHPDKNPDNREVAAEKFRLISQAYECLSDDDKRQEYDRFGVIPGERRVSSEAGGTRATRSAYMGTRSFDPFGPLDPTSMFFTFERAQRIFEAFFGTRDPFSLFDDDPISHSFGGMSMLPSLFESQSSLLGGFLTNDLFGETRGRHGNVHTTSLLSSGTLGGGESVTKSITIVNGRKMTRTETTKIGPDGIARRTVTEEVEDIPGSTHRSHERQRARLSGTQSSREANTLPPNYRQPHHLHGESRYIEPVEEYRSYLHHQPTSLHLNSPNPTTTSAPAHRLWTSESEILQPSRSTERYPRVLYRTHRHRHQTSDDSPPPRIWSHRSQHRGS